MTETITGTDRSAGISFTELLDGDSHPVSETLRAESRIGVSDGNTRVPTRMYTSREVHDLEVERLWSRVWQFACLEADIPGVGDYHVYEIADLSFLVVRTAPDEIKAYRNSCLHRGRLLRETHGTGATNLRCAFHGWAWNLDGSLKEIPCEWDFPSVEPERCSLPEALVDTWHGFVFINPDRGAEPLAEHLGDLERHFAKWPFEKRFKAAHVEKIMRCNWKVCQEAFMESYHVVATHPTLMETLGDANTRYDTYGNYSRAITPHGVESPHLAGMPHWEPLDDGRQFAKYRHPLNGHIYERVEFGKVTVTDLDGRASTFDDEGNHLGGPLTQADPHLCKWIGGELGIGWEEVPLGPPPPDGLDEAGVRAWMAEQRREDARKQMPAVPVDDLSDSEMIDSIYYSVFPNWSPWGVFSVLMYRFRPHGNNPDECIFEIFFMLPAPDPNDPPPPASVTHLGPDDDWTLAPELGPTAKIFQQDSRNLPHVQRGLKASDTRQVILANYNETKIRHFWEHWYRWLEIGETTVTVRPPS
jgi:phenylpropionate dioxygenase-like ring-hydroxylating dioxygenase large terminal subunit